MEINREVVIEKSMSHHLSPMPQPSLPPESLQVTLQNAEDATRFASIRQAAEGAGRRAAGFAMAGLALAGGVDLLMNDAPNLGVNTTVTNILIESNDFIGNDGNLFAGGALVLAGGILIARKRSQQVRELLDTTKLNEKKGAGNAMRKILPPFLIATTAIASGTGKETADAANVPIQLVSQAFGENPQNAYVLLQSAKQLPFDHGNVSTTDAVKVQSYAKTRNGNAVPFNMSLVTQENPRHADNPSSTAMISLPGAVLKNKLGLPFEVDGSKPSSDCSNEQVVTTKQVASANEHVNIDGQSARVIKSLDVFPGLDRGLAVIPLEQWSACQGKGEPLSGVILSGVGNKQKIEHDLTQLGLDEKVIALADWEGNYRDFWKHSVDPPEMQNILYIDLVGLIAGAYIGISDVQRRRRELAILHDLGVQKRTLKVAEGLRRVTDTIKGAAYSAPLIVALTESTNSSQFGLALKANMQGLGAGVFVVTAASVLSTLGANRVINNISPADDLRGAE